MINWTVIFASTPVEFDAAEKKLLNQSSTTPIDYIVGDSSDATVFAGALGKLLVVCSGGGQTGLVVGKVVAMCAEVIELKSGKIFAPSILTKEGITSLLRISTSEKFSTPVSGVRDADNGLDSSDAVSDIFDIQQEATLLLSKILHDNQSSTTNANVPKGEVTTAINELIEWIITLLSGGTSHSRTTQNNNSNQNVTQTLARLMPALTTLLKIPEARKGFVRKNGIAYLAKHLNGNSGMDEGGVSPQALYDIGFCLWTISFELLSGGEEAVIDVGGSGTTDSLLDFSDLAGALPNPPPKASKPRSVASIALNDFRQHRLVPLLVHLVESAPRDKVVRIALATLVNLADAKGEDDGDGNPAETTTSGVSTTVETNNFVTEMVTEGNLLKTIQAMRNSQCKDPDVLESLNHLHKKLLANFKELTTYEKYLVEVKSGKLSWGVTHSEKFFRENARKMENENFGVVKMLIKLIGSINSSEDDTVAIACFDLGEFCRFYPNGRAVVKALRGKDLVMGLIEHENVEVREQALKCVSKILVQKWEFVR